MTTTIATNSFSKTQSSKEFSSKRVILFLFSFSILTKADINCYKLKGKQNNKITWTRKKNNKTKSFLEASPVNLFICDKSFFL